MLHMLAALATIVSKPSPANVEQRARATVTIVRPHRSSAETWKPGSRRNQREIVKQESDGSTARLRLTEYE
jgi:hypothetical protein